MALSLRSCLSSLNSLCLLVERRVPRLIRANPRPSTTTETAPAKNRSRGEAEIVTPNAVNAIADGELATAITAKPVAPAANRVSAKPSAITRKASCSDRPGGQCDDVTNGDDTHSLAFRLHYV